MDASELQKDFRTRRLSGAKLSALTLTRDASHSSTVGLQGLADREDRVARERLVDEHASDAHHRRAAVVALSVELPRLAEEELLLTDLKGRGGHGQFREAKLGSRAGASVRSGWGG